MQKYSVSFGSPKAKIKNNRRLQWVRVWLWSRFVYMFLLSAQTFRCFCQISFGTRFFCFRIRGYWACSQTPKKGNCSKIGFALIQSTHAHRHTVTRTHNHIQKSRMAITYFYLKFTNDLYSRLVIQTSLSICNFFGIESLCSHSIITIFRSNCWS